MEKSQSILDIPLADWPELMKELGEPAFRAQQLAEWIFKRRAASFKEMSNLPAGLREKLETQFTIHSLVFDRAEISQIDGTARYFFKTADSHPVSCVYLPYQERRSICLSTQVGCAWACEFCASGRVKFERNLTVSEILDHLIKHAKAERCQLFS